MHTPYLSIFGLVIAAIVTIAYVIARYVGWV